MFSYYPQPSYYSNPYGHYDDQSEYLQLQRKRHQQELLLQRQRQQELERAAHEECLNRQRLARAQILAQRERRAREEQAYADIMNLWRQNTMSSAPPRTPSPSTQLEEPQIVESENESTVAAPESLPTSSKSPSIETQESAASLIQTTYRIHRSLRLLSKLEAKFQTLKAEFSLPSTVEFVLDGRPVPFAVENAQSTSDVYPSDERAKLAYTPNNVPVHAYIEGLSRLLVDLDAVESWGSVEVRQQRKKIVQAVEQEAEATEMRVQQIYKQGLLLDEQR